MAVTRSHRLGLEDRAVWPGRFDDIVNKGLCCQSYPARRSRAEGENCNGRAEKFHASGTDSKAAVQGRRHGRFVETEIKQSAHAGAATPVVTTRAVVPTNHNDRRARRDNDHSRAASTDTTAMRCRAHAGATAASGVSDIAETDEGGGNQGSGEEIFHVNFLPEPRGAASAAHMRLIAIVP